MGGSVGASESQLKNIAAMEARTQPMTDNQKKKYDADIKKRDNPEPTAGMKTYCKEWLQSQTFKRVKEVNTKYMDKGNHCEDISIRFLNAHYLTDYSKNEKFYENMYMTGTPDIADKRIIDMKNSWDWSTFPLYEEEAKKDYVYQVQAYQSLTKLTDKPAWIVYTLMDAPHHIIVNEAKSMAYRNGGVWEDYFAECSARLTYPDIDDKYKIKKYEVEFNKEMIEEAQERVLMCRKYIEEFFNNEQ